MPSHLRCHRRHHHPTPSLLSWTTTTIDKNDAVWPKNVHVELAEAIHRGDSKGKRETKEHEGGGVGISNGDDAPGFVVRWWDPPQPRDMGAGAGVGTSLAPAVAMPRRTGAAAAGVAMMGPLMTAGADKNATTESRFPQRRSIRWTLQSACTNAGGRGGGGTTRRRQTTTATTAALSRNGAGQGGGGC